MPPEARDHKVAVHLDRLLEERGMTLTELAERVDVTVVNLSVLKNGRARAIRFSTLTALMRSRRLPAWRSTHLRRVVALRAAADAASCLSLIVRAPFGMDSRLVFSG